MKALNRNQRIDLTYFSKEKRFDASILKNKFDIILLFGNNDIMLPEIIGLESLDIPVMARSGDPGEAKYSIKFHKRLKIDHYFHFFSEEFFHELYPKNFKYTTIFFGLEPSLYNIVTPFNKRIKNKILNSGNVGNTKFHSRIINDIRNPHWNTLRCKYLRTKCNELPYVDYTTTLQCKYVNDKFPLLLSKYASAIAADSYTPVSKYWEIPAAGCLTFMEITDKNRGEYIGFKDQENAVFINEKNYKNKFEEFLNETDNPRWEKIANAGKKYALENLNNDKAVESLVNLMEKLLK